MPFNTIPIKDFVGRENELGYLKRFAGFRENAGAGNILLEGARGLGKTELIKQTYRIIFLEENNIVPFYYLFQRGTLKADHFAKDYFTRFVRQYLACLKQDPAFIDAMGTSLTRLIPVIASLGVEWMIDLIEDFEEQVKSGDLYGQMLAAISAPVIAARKSGRPVLIMLDDFHMATRLYETSPGDVPGLLSLFESPMKTSLCPHVMTGSPEGVLEDLFADNSFRGQAERMFLEPLSDDIAYSLFKACCDKLEMKGDKKIVLKFLRVLDGNPLYIRNMVRTLWKQQRRDITERDLWESYSFEVSEGEAAFYLSSIMGEFIRDAGQRRIGIELLMHSIKSNGGVHGAERLAKILDVPESSVISVTEALRLAGLIQGGDKKRDLKDNVLQDFIHSLYMREVDGIRTQRMRELIEARYSSGSGHVLSSFEMVIPVASDAELVAAKAMEQIGRNINLAPDVINHLQLALIESCINAMEHSGNHDQKVFLKFTVSTERIEIVIESSGKFFDTEAVEGLTVEDKLRSEDKRGWGLKLMRTIMDEVRVERIGEKTRVSLIKDINPDDVISKHPAPSRT